MQKGQALPPCRVIRLVYLCGLVEGSEKVTQDVFHITDDRHLSLANLADFCGVDVHVDNFGVGSKLARLPRYTVVKACTQNYEKV